jgi:capsid portal protein
MSITNKAAKSTAKKPQEPKVTFIQKVIKEDTYLVLADSAMALEDEFSGLYYTASTPTNVFIEPPYSAKMLSYMPMQNNILNQCIEAMEVNIDSTGLEFVSTDTSVAPNEKEVSLLTDFFAEPYPGLSFVTMRRLLRREMEAVGYGFLEVLRTVDKKVAAIRNAETHALRLVKLDAPVTVEKTVMRAGVEQKFNLQERERRFVRRVGNTAQNVYYRQFGTSRELNKNTGDWESPANPVAPEDRATELLYFGVNPDVQTDYSCRAGSTSCRPCWVAARPRNRIWSTSTRVACHRH